MIAPIIHTTMIMIVMPIDIHVGDSTHHQDQSMNPVSFSTINAMVSSPVNPIPEDDIVWFAMINSPVVF